MLFVKFVVGRNKISVESVSSVFVDFMNTDCTDSPDYSVSIGLAFRVAVAGGYADPPLRHRGFEMAPSISGSGVLRQGKRRIGETKSMELLNEINGIVRQNQWNR